MDDNKKFAINAYMKQQIGYAKYAISQIKKYSKQKNQFDLFFNIEALLYSLANVSKIINNTNLITTADYSFIVSDFPTMSRGRRK